MLRPKILILILMLLVCMGCAGNKIAYVATGSVLGAGTGYAIDRDVKDAAIGGLVGGTAGAIVADAHITHENKKFQDGYDQGYTRAQLDTAKNNWDENTGKRKEDEKSPVYERIKIPEKEINNVRYESHYETLEVYK